MGTRPGGDAARWFGALYAALAEGEHGMHLEPAIRHWHETDIARTRAALGEAEFDRAWAVGSRLPRKAALMEVEEIVAALADGSEQEPAEGEPSVDGVRR